MYWNPKCRCNILTCTIPHHPTRASVNTCRIPVYMPLWVAQYMLDEPQGVRKQIFIVCMPLMWLKNGGVSDCYTSVISTEAQPKTRKDYDGYLDFHE